MQQTLIDRIFWYPPPPSQCERHMSMVSYEFVISQECDNCKTVVGNIIDCEEGYLFTNDMDYLTERTSLIPKAETGVPGQRVDPRKLFVNEIRLRIDTYFRLVIRNVRDTVPKAIGYFLVRGSMERM